MESSNGLVTFLNTLHQEVIRAAELDGNESLRSRSFTQLMIDDLTEAGVLEDAEPCYHRSRGVEVSGYGFSDDGGTLDLLVTLYRQAESPDTVGKTEIETAFRRLSAFLDRALGDYYISLEEASPAFDMALGIHQSRNGINKVRFFLLTDGLARLEFRPDDRVRGLDASYHIWDARRLYRYVRAGNHREPIHIDLEKDFGGAIPCLTAPTTVVGYTAYLAILPGEVLETIYARYGPRLLELNVRSFLQARGKVNQGIRRTIREQPERFLAYNNGISATARELEFADLGGGSKGIRSISDLQIVNGGQTTASLHHAVKRDGADVSRVFVQAKITVVNDEDVEKIVPLISRYANSQNKVNDADFSANDPFHVRMEELSRTVWAPATDGTQRQTRWFYERARGQYNDAVARQGTPAQIKRFRLEHPNAQRFTKTDLAKFENTWDQLPHLVSLGAQKNFREFTLRLSQRGRPVPDQLFFQRHAAKAILFRRAERLVSAQNFGGYRANIVTYTLAYLSHATSARIDLDRIWERQDISPGLSDAITMVSQHVHEAIANPPGGRNVTEWCKKDACWDRIRQLDIRLPPSLQDELADYSDGRTRKPVQGIDGDTPEERELIGGATRIDAETWFGVSNWAKETSNLAPWQRSLAYSLGKLSYQGREPSRKQARQGLLLLEEAERLGYRTARTP